MSRADDYQMHRGDKVCATGTVFATYWPERYRDGRTSICKNPKPSISISRTRVLMRKREYIEGVIIGWTQRMLGEYEPPSTSQGYYDDYPEYYPGGLLNLESVNVLVVARSVGVDCRYKPIVYVLPEDVIKPTEPTVTSMWMEYGSVPYAKNATDAIFSRESYHEDAPYLTGFYREPFWTVKDDRLWHLAPDMINNHRVYCPEVESPVAGIRRKCLYKGWQLHNCIPLGYTHHATGILQESRHTENWRKWELAQKTWHKVIVVSPEAYPDKQRYSPILLALPDSIELDTSYAS